MMNTEKIHIRELEYEEYNEASRLMWLTYYRFESKGKTMEQIEAFRDSIESVSLSMNSYDGRMTLLGAFDINEKLIGVGGIKLKTYADEEKDFVNEKDHITLLFINSEYHRRGIGSSLLSKMILLAKNRAEKRNESFSLTVNSSDFAVGFYESCGFKKTGGRQDDPDGVYTPMRYTLSKQ